MKRQNIVENDPKVIALLSQADSLIQRSIDGRGSLTQDEIEDLRLEIAEVRYKLSREVLQRASNEASLRELEEEAEVTKQFAKYYKAYSTKLDDKGKPMYSRSGAESFARNSYKLKDNPVFARKQLTANAKAFEKMLYQALKGLDQVTNALAAISKRIID